MLINAALVLCHMWKQTVQPEVMVGSIFILIGVLRRPQAAASRVSRTYRILGTHPKSKGSKVTYFRSPL